MGKLRTILHNNSGASMMFVLAAMLLLMPVCSSAMNAAIACRGAWLARKDQHQLSIYGDSIHRAIGSSMNQEEIDGTLAELVVGMVMEQIPGHKHTDGRRVFYPGRHELTAAVTGLADGPELSGIYGDIKITADYQVDYTWYNKSKWREVWELDEDEDIWVSKWTLLSLPEQQKAVINADIEVEVAASYRGKTLTSFVKYKLSGAEKESDVDIEGIFKDIAGEVSAGEKNFAEAAEADAADSIEMKLTNTGNWEVIAHGRR
ncbi:MAG: hypothetical protein FWH06_06885 [Oscillospiraceae bacterium]|nr:hypothetical protein [Oscillospiraceae bacterium]